MKSIEAAERATSPLSTMTKPVCRGFGLNAEVVALVEAGTLSCALARIFVAGTMSYGGRGGAVGAVSAQFQPAGTGLVSPDLIALIYVLSCAFTVRAIALFRGWEPTSSLICPNATFPTAFWKARTASLWAT